MENAAVARDAPATFCGYQIARRWPRASYQAPIADRLMAGFLLGRCSFASGVRGIFILNIFADIRRHWSGVLIAIPRRYKFRKLLYRYNRFYPYRVQLSVRHHLRGANAFAPAPLIFGDVKTVSIRFGPPSPPTHTHKNLEPGAQLDSISLISSLGLGIVIILRRSTTLKFGYITHVGEASPDALLIIHAQMSDN